MNFAAGIGARLTDQETYKKLQQMNLDGETVQEELWLDI